jgi:hypothetical protein
VSRAVPIVYASVESELNDNDRRASLFAGDLIVYGPRPSTLSVVDLAHHMIEQMLGANPQWAQQRLSESEFSVLFSGAERNFSHRQSAIELVSQLATDLGCDPSTTYVSRPSISAITGHGFLPHGLGGPQHPHRDTWFAASPCQVNWWLPLYDVDTSSAIAFHPRYWESPIPNSSVDFNYERWQEEASRSRVPGQAIDPMSQPRPLDTIVLTPDLRIGCPAGGVILSSVAQLRSTVPNDSLITYFSAHFQTVSQADLLRGSGPFNVDARASGTSLATFVRCDDFSPVPPELVQRELERRQIDVVRDEGE